MRTTRNTITAWPLPLGINLGSDLLPATHPPGSSMTALPDDLDLRMLQIERLRPFVEESNRIEGIHREATLGELAAHRNLLDLDALTVEALCEFVQTVAGAHIRSKPGMDVRVGGHLPPPGGPDIPFRLEVFLREDVNAGSISPWEAHTIYETLHPFMDGNGRSGRAVWAWMMQNDEQNPFALPFLHRAYYQALDSTQRRGA